LEVFNLEKKDLKVTYIYWETKSLCPTSVPSGITSPAHTRKLLRRAHVHRSSTHPWLRNIKVPLSSHNWSRNTIKTAFSVRDLKTSEC